VDSHFPHDCYQISPFQGSFVNQREIQVSLFSAMARNMGYSNGKKTQIGEKISVLHVVVFFGRMQARTVVLGFAFLCGSRPEPHSRI
jgi:hypothetical protein